MKSLIVSSTIIEVEPILRNYGYDSSIVSVGNVNKLNENFDLLICGAGIIHALYNTLSLINKSPGVYDRVINIGIAGTFNKSRDKGDVVMVTKDCFADLGVETEKSILSLYDLKWMKEERKAYGKQFLKYLEFNILQNCGDLPKVSSITVALVTSETNRKQKFISAHNPELETMEGAVIGFIGKLEGIDVVQIRSISNYVGEQDKGNWKKELAIENLNNIILNKLLA